MGLLALMEPQARLVTKAGALYVEIEGERIRTVPLTGIREVHLYGSAEVSAEARNLLLRERIDVVYLTAHGRYRGRLTAGASSGGALRLAQYGLLSDVGKRLALSAAIVEGKVRNQRALLLERGRDVPEMPTIADDLDALGRRACTAPDLDGLRGLEGAAARRYFEGFGLLIRNAAFVFDGRNRRPPKDPVNAALSYGYTMLVVAVESAIRAVGLDVALAALHEPGRGGPVLAYDLAEEFRPAVDSVVLTLVNRRELAPEDFRTPGLEDLDEDPDLEGAVYLGKVGRQILVRAWERRLDHRVDHPLGQGQWTLRNLMQEQARQVARIALGEQETYHSLRLRG